jgi:fumarylacetoacetate (FAA) hydrolase
MKLASIRDGSRDGQLAVVSRDLRTAQFATEITGTLQRALDDWNFFAPQLQDLYAALNASRARHAFVFDPSKAAAPLPRAFQWAAATPDGVLAQRPSDILLGASEGPVADTQASLTAQIVAITGDVPQGVRSDAASDCVRLLALSADWRLPAPPGLEGVTLPDRQHTVFGPVVVTPDEVGAAWKRGKIHLPLTVSRNGKVVGRPDAGAGTRTGLHLLIALLAQTRPARAGSLIGSGVIAGLDEKAAADARDMLRGLEAGDRIRLEMLDVDGRSLFGAIEHVLDDHPADVSPVGGKRADAPAAVAAPEDEPDFTDSQPA